MQSMWTLQACTHCRNSLACTKRKLQRGDGCNVIRSRAKEYAFHTDRVGVIGFSAGGHLASVAATMFEKSVRPNFQMLIYAATNVETPFWNPWKARYGYPGQDANTCDRSTAQTPPLFAAVSTKDVAEFSKTSLRFRMFLGS